MAVVTGKDEQLLIGGRVARGRIGRALRRDQPGDRRDRRHACPTARQEDVQAAIDAAAGALDGWKSLAAIERARILRRAADVIRERKDEIAAVMTAEQGKPLAEAAGEVDYAASFFEWFGGEAERVYGQVVPADEPGEPRPRAAPAGRRRRRDHAVELPGRDDDPQARPGDGRRLHERRQARERHTAHRRARPARDRGRGRASGRRQPRHLALVRDGRRDDLLRPRVSARSRSPARPRSARS